MSDYIRLPFGAILDLGDGDGRAQPADDNAQFTIKFLSGVKGHSKLLLTSEDYHS